MMGTCGRTSEKVEHWSICRSLKSGLHDQLWTCALLTEFHFQVICVVPDHDFQERPYTL